MMMMMMMMMRRRRRRRRRFVELSLICISGIRISCFPRQLAKV
jgi:hypothetical protein